MITNVFIPSSEKLHDNWRISSQFNKPDLTHKDADKIPVSFDMRENSRDPEYTTSKLPLPGRRRRPTLWNERTRDSC